MSIADRPEDATPELAGLAPEVAAATASPGTRR